MNSLLRRSNSMILKNNAVSHKLSITTAPAKAWISNRGLGAVFWLLYTDVFILVRSTSCFLDNNFIVRCMSFISLSYVKIFYCWLFVLDILFCWKQACILGRNCLYYIFSFLFLFLCSTDSGIFHFIKFIYT